MAKTDFVHLHVHSHYSLLDGACRIGDLVARTKELGMDTLAITDHGNMFGAVEFYSAAKDAGIKPIIGCEMYVAPTDRRDRTPSRMDEASYHLLLLAMNRTGYQNLLRLASIAYLEGFYYRPRIDKQILTEHSEGLICTSSCLAGEVLQSLMKEDRKAAKAAAEEYLRMFGPERYYLEVQDHGIPEQRKTNPMILDLAREMGIGVIAANDVHYVNREDHQAHDVLCCINTGKRVEEEGRFRFPSDQFYLRSGEEMAALFADHPETLDNTRRIADMCELDLDFGTHHAPSFAVPEPMTDVEYLRKVVYENAIERYGDPVPQHVCDRIDYELSVITGKGFSSYFLIVWDLVNYARQRKIPVGSRGSAGGTVVGYCLKISNEDPLTYGLQFERFMDPERDEMPDIDIDICQNARGELIEYVRKKYGHVAQIITFTTMAARAVIRDVGRALGRPLNEVDAIAKKVPAGPKVTLQSALEAEPDLKKEYQQNDDTRKLIDIALRLEGLARNASVHAAGVVVASQPLDNVCPLYKASGDGEDIITQFEGKTVEKVGLLKMDFLGLRTLTIIQRAVDLIKYRYGKEIDVEKLPLDDEKVYRTFSAGNVKGVFQFESDGMRDLLRKLQPDALGHLIAANALYRPGPMQLLDDFIQRRHGASWTVPHPILEEELADTYGIMVYQEQVMRILNRLGSIPLGRAYRLIKAISKKKHDVIAAEKEHFIKGSVENGVAKAKAEELFGLIERFGGYGFNKSHSTRYAIVAYQTAYLKTYYPYEYMAALLTFEMVNNDKVVEYIDHCRELQIEIRPPDINESYADFTVVDDDDDTKSIRFGLAAIKGVGSKAVEAIIEARDKGGRFDTLYDFCERVDAHALNRSTVEAMIKAGAFDSTGATRRGALEALEDALQAGHRLQHDAEQGQMNFFDMFGGGDDSAEANTDTTDKRLTTPEFDQPTLLRNEKDCLGFFVTSHPLSEHADLIRRYGSVTTRTLRDKDEGTEVVIGGLVQKVRPILTRNGKNAGSKMAAIMLQDLQGNVEIAVFPRDYERLRDLLVVDSIVFVKGTVDRRREEPSIRVNDIIPIDRAVAELTSEVHFRIGAAEDELTIERLAVLCRDHHGGCPVYIDISSGPAEMIIVRADSDWSVRPTPELLSAATELLGPDRLNLRGRRGCA